HDQTTGMCCRHRSRTHVHDDAGRAKTKQFNDNVCFYRTVSAGRNEKRIFKPDRKKFKINNMKAFVFPGQGAQFEGMGADLYESSEAARKIFQQADDILGFSLSKVMFEGSAEDLKQTKITQPALFVHALAKWNAFDHEKPDAVAGHSLGEFSALVANGTLRFEDGLKLVFERAMAMQEACEKQAGTMAAILGLEDSIVEEICGSIEEIVVPANSTCQGQRVISGSLEGIRKATEKLTEAGAKRALVLEVGGAFHSPLMEPARIRLEKAIQN